MKSPSRRVMLGYSSRTAVMKSLLSRLPLPSVLALALALTAAGAGTAADPTPNASPTHPDFEVQVTGRGRPVVFIPGLATPGGIWQPTVDALKATCQCHVLTLAGFGGAKPTGADPFLPRVRDEIIDYLRSQKLDHPVIVGHSLGGVMALWIGETAPELPGALVIVDAMPFMAAIMDPAATMKSARAQIAPMVAQVGGMSPGAFAGFQHTMIQQWVTSPEQAAAVSAETSKSDPRTTARALGELMSTDLRGDLNKITCPTLVLCALADKTVFTPKEEVMNLFHKQYAGLGNVRFEPFDSARHFIMVDDPEGFMKSLHGELAARTK